MEQTNLVGKSILGYNVVEKLGSGAFGTVYKVIKTNAAGRYIRALKHIVIPTEKQYNSVLNSMGGDISKADSYFSQMLNNIVSEIRILNELSEKGIQHIVRYYENDIHVMESPKRYDIFILMEYLTPLEDFIQETDFRVRDVVGLGLDVLHGLQACHNNGIIHRDIKDDNIFVSEKGEYKIGDFGVSKVLKDSSKAESLKGTPNFLAPEVYLGKEGYTKSVDLYSLGIVLYRLLNYSRNPFLPRFPEQFFSQDEDAAFEDRMGGKTPELPSLGGERIGYVIVKAIAGGSERFQTADEFIAALELAVDGTSADILDETIGFHITDRKASGGNRRTETYGATLGETLPLVSPENCMDGGSINRHLFESVGEIPPVEIPEIDIAVRHGRREENGNLSAGTGSRVVNIVQPPVSGSGEPAALDKKVMDKFIFLAPVMVLLIGVVAYFVVVPDIYGKVISFADWLFTNPEKVIDTLRNQDAVLPKVSGIIGMRIFSWVWLAGLTVSLFFVGRQLQKKTEPDAVDAILTKKEPYLLVQEVSDSLKRVKTGTDSGTLDSLAHAVKMLEERLAVESDFGYGKNDVINCENNIAKQIQFLLDTIPYMEKGDLDENINAMNGAIANINFLLRKRMELKKR